MAFSCLRTCCLVAILLFAPGCGGTSSTTGSAVDADHTHADGHDHDGHDHDGHDHDGQMHHETPAQPETFSAAVALIATHASTIKQAFADGKPAEADAAVHAAFKVVQLSPKLLSETNLAADAQQSTLGALQTVSASLQEIHKGFHGGDQQTKYEDVAEDFEAAVKTLEEQAAAAGQ